MKILVGTEVIYIRDYAEFDRLSKWVGISTNSFQGPTIEPIKPDRFWYKAKNSEISVIDGDTISVQTDLTMSVYHQVALRLAGINAPEINTEAGKLSKSFLQSQVEKHEWFWIKTVQNRSRKQKKTFDRYIAFIFDPYGNLINDIMVANLHAESYMVELFDQGDSFIQADLDR